MRRLGIGVDVGGTFIKLAAVDASGRVVRRGRLPTEPQRGPLALVEKVSRLLQTWREPAYGRAPLGLGLAGDVDAAKGRLRFTPNLSGWEGFDFKAALSRRLGRPVVVDNDANCAVWGAYATELKRKPKCVVGVTLGTGVGGGLVIDGRLYRGATGSAGEIGHTRVVESGELCHCGQRGCLEAYAGNYGIVRAARRLLSARPSSGRILRRLSPDLSALTPQHLTQAAAAGDAVAREVWWRTGGLLAVGLANVVLLLNPDVLLLLGGVSRAGRWLTEPLRQGLASQVFRTPFRHAVLRLADNHDGGCVGAALLALESSRRPPR